MAILDAEAHGIAGVQEAFGTNFPEKAAARARSDADPRVTDAYMRSWRIDISAGSDTLLLLHVGVCRRGVTPADIILEHCIDLDARLSITHLHRLAMGSISRCCLTSLLICRCLYAVV